MVDGRWTVNPVQGNTVGSNPTTPTKILTETGSNPVLANREAMGRGRYLGGSTKYPTGIEEVVTVAVFPRSNRQSEED